MITSNTRHQSNYGTKLKKTLLGSICLAAGFAACQEASAATTTASGDNLLEEIVVSARRRSEDLQKVPVTVQVFDSSTLEAANIQSLYEITNRIPGAKFNLENATDPQIFIRGIGSDIQGAGADSSVGIFIDGVYMSRSSGVLVDLFDLERVEVLKGPQSLRFGKNIVGGLIQYITKKPGDTLEGKIQGTVGNYNAVNVGASIRGPLTDTLSAGITVSSRTHDGFATNTLGGDEEDISVQSVRASLRYRPNTRTDIILTGDYTRHRDGARWVDVAVAGDSDAVTYNQFFAPPIPGLPADFTLPARNAPFKNSDPRKGPRNFTGYQNSDLYGISLHGNFGLSDALNLNSITAYRKSNINVREDAAGMYWDFPLDPDTSIPIIDSVMATGIQTYLNTVPDDWFDNHKKDDVKQISQEFRFSWDDGGKLQWSAGAYFLHEKITRLERVGFYFPDFDAITNFAYSIAYGGDPAVPAGGTSNNLTSSKATNIGLFGEFTYNFTDTFALNAGLRYAYDKKDFTAQRFGQSFDAPLPPGGFIASDSQSWHAWLPSITLTYQPTDTQNYYVRVERGYQSGGYTGEGAGNPLDAIVSFSPEYALSYEAGSKLLLAERRLRLNTTVFYTKYTDLQTQQFLQLDPTRPPDNFVVNADNGTKAYGLELEFQARITRGLNVHGNYAYTRCKFTGTLIIDEAGTDIDGNTCRRTPKHSFNVGAQYAKEISNNLVMLFGADTQWTGKYFFTNDNDPRLLNDSEFTVNLHAGVESADDRWKLGIWVKNVTNELNHASMLELFGTIYTNYQAPRTFGATLTYKIGE